VSTIGSTRRIDHLGRIVLPIELRRSLGINDGDEIEITARGDRIILRKLDPTCAICGAADELVEMHDKHVCSSCIAEIRQARRLQSAFA
jgi:transcriptional pleiotropic regulator of transition state genes